LAQKEYKILPWFTGGGWLWGGLFLVGAVAYGMSSGVRSEVVILFYVYTLLGLGIYLPLELTDQVSLAYSAYFGIGAYSYAVCSAAGRFDPVIGILIGVVLSGVLAAIVGLATMRLSGYFLAVATMLVALIFGRFLIQSTPLTGGPTGIGFPKTLLGMSVSRGHLLIGGAVIVWLMAIALTNLRWSSTGKALLLLSRSWAAAESIGLETRRARIVTLCLGACVASLAGSILALNSGFVIPESYSLMVSFLIIFIPLIGGARTPWGSLVGAAIVCYVLQVAHQFGPSQLLFGLTTLAVVLLLPGGLLGALQIGIGRLAVVLKAPKKTETRDGSLPEEREKRLGPGRSEIMGPSTGNTLLRISSISKRFGGLQALSQVSFEVKEGEIVGIVGPNGAGKSTLVDIITGVQEADSGDVTLTGIQLTQGPAFRAHLGISRTFQHPQLAQGLTVLENIRLGYLRVSAPRSWSGLFIWFLRNMVFRDRGEPGGVMSNKEILTEGGNAAIENEFSLLSKSLNAVVTDVSYGTEKLTESVRALVSSPLLLMMDEPFAGLDSASIEAIWRILRCWRSRGLGAVIVDHNVDVLRDMCDRIIVLNYGQVIAEGRPHEVLQNPEVRKAYFGDE
jgi:ABC-type branched-subunit amino acid transport system ATPase component/ABC-type branched-subunit amino acid transport system permease subunit